MKLETIKAHQVNCVIDDEVMQLIDRCRELLSGKYPTGVDYNKLLLELAKSWLEKNDPVERAERREKRKQKAARPKPKTQEPGETSRYISPAIKDAVYNRDGGRCTYVGSDGKRCNSTWDLEIHHDGTPYALDGEHRIHNLKLLCAVHNKLMAERVFGRGNQERFKRKRE
jgi:5-methylcytosine-specific restriction endonuclease McrA